MKAKSKSRRTPSSSSKSHGRPAPQIFAEEGFAEKFASGAAHFNARRFFEAHESWEEIWLRSHGDERRRLQGIIQIAAAFHHHSRRNLAGTKSLLRAGFAKIEDAPSNHWGLQLGPLRASLRRWIALMEKDRSVAAKIPPKLRRSQ